jgi:hypothetical protein
MHAARGPLDSACSLIQWASSGRLPRRHTALERAAGRCRRWCQCRRSAGAGRAHRGGIGGAHPPQRVVLTLPVAAVVLRGGEAAAQPSAAISHSTASTAVSRRATSAARSSGSMRASGRATRSNSRWGRGLCCVGRLDHQARPPASSETDASWLVTPPWLPEGDPLAALARALAVTASEACGSAREEAHPARQAHPPQRLQIHRSFRLFLDPAARIGVFRLL